MRRVTLQDIADHLKLSRSAVSRALRQSPKIPPETRRRVEVTCKKMGYRPNPMLSEMASAHWQDRKPGPETTIAFIDCQQSNASIRSDRPSLALEAAARQLGYQMQTFRRCDFASSTQLQRLLRARGITDVVLGPVLDPALTVELDWDKFICVQMLPSYLSHPLHSVVRDYFNSILLFWEKAVAYGYRRIGIMLLEHSQPVFDDLVRFGAVVACQKIRFHQLPKIPPFRFDPANYELYDVFKWIRKESPEVILALNDSPHPYLYSEFGDKMAFASLHATRPGISGIPDAFEDSIQESINLLHFCRRTHQWGIPKVRIDHVLEPTWIDGGSMPRTKSKK